MLNTCCENVKDGGRISVSSRLKLLQQKLNQNSFEHTFPQSKQDHEDTAQ